MTAWTDRIATLTQPKWWLKLDGTTAGSNPTTESNSGNFGAWVGTSASGATAGCVAVSNGISNTYWNFPNGNNASTGQRVFSFDPSGSDSSAIFGGTPWTIEFWIRPNIGYSNSTNFGVFWVSASRTEPFLDAYIPRPGITNAGKLVFRFGGTTVQTLVSTNAIDDGSWHHVVFTYGGASNSHRMRLYIDGVQNGSDNTNGIGSFAYTLFDRYSNLYIGMMKDGASTGSYRGDLDEFLIYDYELTSTQVAANKTAGTPAISINYTNTSGATASATSPDATWAATTVINATYNSGVFIADTAVIVQPSLSIGSNLDSFGFSTASAEIANPNIVITSNINYSAEPLTASALSPNSAVSTQKFVNYSASPATASALLSSNFYGGNTVQDATYELNIRRIGPSANNGPGGGIQLDSIWDASGNFSTLKHLAIKPVSGIPANNKIVKARFNPTALYMSQTTFGVGRVEIRVFTEAPKNGKTFDNMLIADLPNSELLHITRPNDEASNSLTSLSNLDLTAAFADSRAATYGIHVVSHEYPDLTGIKPTNRYSVTDWNANNPNQIQHELIYFLEADVIAKNVNADVMTASGILTDVTVLTDKSVNVLIDPSTASADVVNASVSTQRAVTISSDPLLASALSVQPTFARTVEFPHEHKEAFADMANPTVFAFGTITYAAAPATASADLHMPQFDIGENNSADHMNASALFVMPTLIIPRVVDVMTTTASVLMVDPTVNAQLLGAYNAQVMTANAMSPNPPAYINLLGDEWYATLYAQHSVRAVGFPAGYSSAFLKLYEDQNTDITQSTPNTAIPGAPGGRTYRELYNNLTYGIVVNSGPENDASLVKCGVITDYSTPENESRLSVGYFDPYGRKAIRLQNIGIRMAQPLYHARADFSLEFSIKTTKADQILSYGEWSSPTGPGRVRSLYNLVDGKLNAFLYTDDYRLVHPKQRYGNTVVSGTSLHGITGYKPINDGQWHHVIMQYTQGTTDDGEQQGRFQIWIDGELDIQRFGARLYEPDYFGANLENSTYAPDFYTSATSLDAPGFIAERDIDLHYYDYVKYEPILAEPMTASLTMTQDNKGAGNRKRALMLYWWPSNTGQNKNFIFRQFDTGRENSSFPDFPMFDYNLDTIDYIKQPPQQYYGWDVFPVDINGYYVSDLVKEQAYGGAENIVENDVGGAVGPYDGPRPQFKVNRSGFFRNPKDDTRRYIDLVNDIDLSQFDAIFFKNYPDQSREQESFAKNEIVDKYFNIRETVIFENFIKGLRAAVDTGISLMVNNPQLALDLKIVDRIELVPDLNDVTGYQSDPYTPTIVPEDAKSLPINTGNSANLWFDAYRNNRIRVLNTIPGLTDWRSVVHTKMAFWANDDTIDFGGASREFHDYDLKPNGLAVGDEFFLNTTTYNYTNIFGQMVAATPINNVLCGTPITAFANQYRRGLDLVDNPYKNHVTSIAIKPGDVLNGKQVGGKIWVNFTEPIPFENEEAYIDAIHTEWIEAAYFDEAITLQERNELIASINNLETRLNQGIITQAEYADLASWASNGMYLLAQSREIEAGDPGKSDFGGEKARKGTVRKTSRTGITSSSQVSFNQQWFLFTYSKQYRQLAFDVISMNTRGFRWISDRVEAVAQNQAHTAMPASATMVQPVVVGQKSNNITVQPMLANAIKVAAVGFAGVDRNIISLPLEASARITEPVRKVPAEPMTVSAAFREQVVIRTTAQDQVVVYVLHEDPILYLREDIIK